MKALAYVVNTILFVAMVVLACLIAKDGWSGLWVEILIGVVPVISMLALFKADRGGDIIALYLQRKRLEQEKKIFELEKSMQDK